MNGTFVMKVPEGASLSEAELIQKLAAWQNLKLFWPNLRENSALVHSRGIARPVVGMSDGNGLFAPVAVGFWQFADYLQREGLVLL